MFFPTHEQCCQIFFKGFPNCIKYDEGCTIEGTSTNNNDGNGNGDGNGGGICEDEWHPDVITKTGCTNDPTDYPQEWKTNNDNMYFFSTINECCAIYHFSGVCPVRDACTNTITNIDITNAPTNKPTSAPNECKWHPSMKSSSSMKPRCDYSNEYPDAWNNPEWSDMYLFDTHLECCVGGLGVDYECDKVAYCETPDPTFRPTTMVPSDSPSTIPPSLAPTTKKVRYG